MRNSARFMFSGMASIHSRYRTVLLPISCSMSPLGPINPGAAYVYRHINIVVDPESRPKIAPRLGAAERGAGTVDLKGESLG
ncbi:hypothetical protein RHEC894_PB00001 (plasmid) [Rhizobium sp. CIAT894]|nr:hypothetical protein RHEC894_PB00001 [Rhizobium sp. CIAT894]